MNKITTIFASSDGCTPKPPMPNQRRAPLIGALEQHGNQRDSTTTPSAGQMTTGCR